MLLLLINQGVGGQVHPLILVDSLSVQRLPRGENGKTKDDIICAMLSKSRPLPLECVF